MRSFAFAAAVVLFSAASVSAHGYVTKVVIDGKTYEGYNPYKDPFSTTPVQKIFRKITWNGPVEDVTSIDLQCGGRNGQGTSPAPLEAPATAGSDIAFSWSPWPDSHHGPSITYLAKCDGSCTEYMPGKEPVWFKIDEVGRRDNGRWGTDDFIPTNNQQKIRIPESLAPGNYLVRHELIALHFAYQYPGAQLYPNCFQIKVEGNGTSTGPVEKVAFPGAYSSSDEGIVFDLYLGPEKYPIPGPQVWQG